MDKDYVKEVIEGLGGARALMDEMDEYHQIVARMRKERPGLMERHPDKWVAMGKEEYGSAEPHPGSNGSSPCKHGHGVGDLGRAVYPVEDPHRGKAQVLGGAEPVVEVGGRGEITEEMGGHEDAKLGGSGHCDSLQ